MALCWEEFLALAQHLHDEVNSARLKGGGEPLPANKIPLHDAKLRSAISRAYYCSIHLARHYLESELNKKYPKDGTAHQDVADDLIDVDPPLGAKLKTLKEHRRQADYDEQFREPGKIADVSIRFAIEMGAAPSRRPLVA